MGLVHLVYFANMNEKRSSESLKLSIKANVGQSNFLKNDASSQGTNSNKPSGPSCTS